MQEWLEELLTGPDFIDHMKDERYALILTAIRSKNEALRLLFRGGAWLDKSLAQQISRLGILSLRCYYALAAYHVERKLPRYPIHPKFHMLFHTYRNMQRSSTRNEWTESPCVDVCSQDETFVGFVCRSSRRVSPTITIDRTWDVYFAALHRRWQERP